jgi:Tfp pilus assembly major pilin PilA
MMELIIVIAILAILSAIVTYSFHTVRIKKQLEVTIDSISFKLEEAKTNALAGKNGSNFGVEFDTDSYTYFTGTTYNSSSPNNVLTTIPENLEITTNLGGGATAVVFSRMTGVPQTTGTITVTNINNPSFYSEISIGQLGDINVLK